MTWRLPDNTESLVILLGHSDGSIREKAKKKLFHIPKGVIKMLKENFNWETADNMKRTGQKPKVWRKGNPPHENQ